MAETLVEQEKDYHIFKDAAGDFMILIRARMTDAEQPKIVYNGGTHALFYRNKQNTIVLDYVHPDVRKDLSTQEAVLVVEARENSVIREYTVPMMFLKEVPLPATLELNA